MVAPYPLIDGTDSRNFESLCDEILRITPFVMQHQGLDLLHGTNERVSRENLVRRVRFFVRRIRTMDERQLRASNASGRRVTPRSRSPRCHSNAAPR